MNEKDRGALKSYYTPGARPNSAQFGFFIDACANLTEVNDNNLRLNGSIKVGTHMIGGGISPTPGCIQYNTATDQFEGFIGGGTNNWAPLGGGAITNPLTVGTARCGTYAGADPSLNNAAVFSHMSRFSNNNGQDFALAQGPGGEVIINSGGGNPIFFANNANPIMEVSGGNLTIFNGDLNVNNGDVNVPGGVVNTSDVRVKEDIRPFTEGLQQLAQIKTVKYRYNGKADTPAGKENIGIVAQEIEKIFPYMVKRKNKKLNPEDQTESEVLHFDTGPIMYVMINAIKELSEEVNKLKTQLASANA